MKPTRDEVVEMIERHAATPTPPTDPAFVDRLERRLRSLELTPKAGPRRIGRFTVSAVVAGTMIAGVAAAAGVVTLRHVTEPAKPTATTTSVAPPTTLTTIPTTTVEVAIPVPTPVVATTVLATPATTAAAPATTAEPTTVAEPTTTTPPVTTVVATTSTEVRVAATLSLACTPTASTIDCTWDAGPDGTAQYALLRTDPTSTQGRVFTTPPGTTTYSDALVTPGVTYTYLVHALDSARRSLAHSDHVDAPCCG